MRQFLVDVSHVRPFVVLIHDLDAGDDASFDLFAWLAENLELDPTLAGTVDDDLETERFRGLILATASDGEVADRLRRDVLPRSPVASALPLSGLDADGVRAFLSSPEVVERILTSTGGRPDGLRDLLDLMPANVEDLFQRRLLRVGEVERTMLEVLAVAGRALDAETLWTLAGSPEGRPGAVLSSLVERRLVTRTFEGGSLRFELQRAAHAASLTSQAGASRLELLHGRVAAWLESSQDRTNATPEALAQHYLQSDAPAAAWPHVEEAVRRLTATCAHGRAAALVAQALDAAPPPEEDRATWLEVLCDLHEARGDVDRALFYAGRLKRLTPAAERGPVLLRVGRLLTERGDLRLAARVLARAEGLVGTSEPRLSLRLAAARAEVCYLLSDFDAAEALCSDALAMRVLGHSGAGRERVALRNTLGKTHLAREDASASAELFRANLADARAAGDVREEARARINLGIARLLQSDPAGATAHYEAALGLAEEQGDVVLAAMAHGNLAVIAHRRQEYARALDHYHRSVVALRKVGNHTQLATAINNLGDMYLVLGDAERARRMADFALAANSAGESRYGQACNQLLLGDIAVATGRYARAERCFDAAHAILSELGGRRFAAHLRLRLARLALLCGRSRRARELLDGVAAAPGGDAPDVAASVDLLSGEVAVDEGVVEGTGQVLRRALDAFERLDDREGQWRAHLALALAYRGKGQPARGMEHLEGAGQVIESVAAQLPVELRQAYSGAPQRTAVDRELRRLREDLGLVPQAPEPTPVTRPVVEASELRRRYSRMVGESPRLHRVFSVLDRVARTDSTVLLLGESGTGKELAAQALHENSGRASGPFVRVNCAAFVETLLLSELFGHEKGAYTGAVSRRQGRFELANGGTIFLDEIGDIPPKTQVALLRVLQEREFERVGGGGRPIKVDVRVVCATNRDLDALVESGDFRMDLYYRLKGVTVELPPLRDRSGDVAALAQHFLDDQRRKGATGAREIAPDAHALLEAFPWPGNVRELENVVRSVSLFVDTETLTAADVEDYEQLTGGGSRITTPAPAVPEAEVGQPAGVGGADPESAVVEKVITGSDISLAGMKKRIEIECILRALRETEGNITQAARLLKMKRPRLSQIIKASIDLDRLQAKEGVLEP